MSSEPTTRPPSYARVSLALMTSGREANLLGNIHGGEIVKLADSTAGAVAQRHCGGPAVTAALDEMAFLEPVHVGDIVRTYAQVSAYFVFVAVDAEGRARPVPPLAPET